MDNRQKYACLSANYIDNNLPQDETDYEVEKIVSEYFHSKWGMCYFVKYVNHEFLENDEHLLLQGEMFNCPRVLHDWKYRDATKRHETGDQCMIIAVNIYFQHSFGQEFIENQLRRNKSDPKVC